jgi:hypothetical protein
VVVAAENRSLSKGELGSLSGICSAASSMLMAGTGERSGASMVKLIYDARRRKWTQSGVKNATSTWLA